MNRYTSMMVSMLLLSIGIRNVWPQKMSIRAHAALYILLLFSTFPILFLSIMQYGLFGTLMVICFYGLISYRNTRPQNICMGFLGCILTVIVDQLLVVILTFITPDFILNNPYTGFCALLFQIVLFSLITWFIGGWLKKWLLRRKGLLQMNQIWHIIDAALLFFTLLHTFGYVFEKKGSSIITTIYHYTLLFTGFFMVMLFLFLSMFSTWQEKARAEAKQRSFQDLSDYTRNLELMYGRLRSFKHDYINILLSLSGYIENGDMEELKHYFENKILPTGTLISQGDYKLSQLGNIGVLEIKSLLSAKLIYAHETGIDVTVDIPDPVAGFSMDTVDLARILGIFLDNAIEAAMEADQPKTGLNIIQNPETVAIIISNSFRGDDLPLYQLKRQGFSTKKNHSGIGLSNAQELINAYDNILLETTKQGCFFTQYMEIGIRRE